MSHVSSSDSLNGRRTSSDSGKDPEGPGGLSAPSDPAGPRLSPERRGSGPVVPRRKSSDTGKERRSCSSLSEKETAESPVSNGCINSVEEDQIKSNGVDHAVPSDDADAALSSGSINSSADAEC